jgi:hypothetical protein
MRVRAPHHDQATVSLTNEGLWDAAATTAAIVGAARAVSAVDDYRACRCEVLRGEPRGGTEQEQSATRERD